MGKEFDFATAMLKVRECDVDIPTYMTPNNYAAAKKEFMAAGAELRYPRFEYDRYDLSDQKDQLGAISNWFVTDIRGLEKREIDASYDVLYEYIRRVSAKLRVLEQMQSFRKESSERGRRLIVMNNMTLNHVPDMEIFQKLYYHPEEAKKDFLPSLDVLERFWELLLKKFGKTLDRIDGRDQYTAQEVCDFVNVMIEEDYGFETDFYAEVNQKKTQLNVNQLSHVFEVPEKRSKGPYTSDVMRDIIVGHENGHMYRAAFMTAKHPELAIMLPGYEVFEEGVTQCMEQAFGGDVKELKILGKETYVINGLAYCMNYDFRDTFQHYCDYWRKENPGKEMSEDELNTAFSRVTRAFRGTGVIPWTAGTVYFDGPMKVWKYIALMLDTPEKLMRNLFEAGKTDPTLPLHQQLLKKYDWTDADFVPVM